MTLEFEERKIIQSSDWDKFVCETYGRPYCFQQQAGYRDRGTYEFTVPDPYGIEFCGPISLSEWANEEIDPNPPLKITFHWHRIFHPDYMEVASDLHKRGLIKSGTYYIEVD